jgi:predicted outer membrane repeat protein
MQRGVPMRWTGVRAIVGVLLVVVLLDTADGAKPDIQAVQKKVRDRQYKFQVGPNPATQYTLEQLCGLKIPPNISGQKLNAPLPPQKLPASLDWRKLDGCSPVKNQGGCGSCWAFAAMGVVESQYLIQSYKTLDLSEQWLVSCTDAGTCDGGFYGRAFDFMVDAKDKCVLTGALLEDAFPYKADDVPCTCPPGDRYLITKWSSLSQDIVSMKMAIMTYGPIAVGIAADDMFQCYVGGVFDANVGTDLNHAVVLVGWDDTQGTKGVWYLRNSWGTGWGEGGYMRIEYDCNKVGASPAWARCIPDNEPNYLDVPKPFANIKAALTAANKGDVITLAPGVYSGPNNTNINLAGKDVLIRSINPADPDIVAQTIIDCKSAGRAFSFEKGEGPGAMLYGLTIKNGNINDNGGAVYCYYSNPTIKHCVFENNKAAGTILKKNGGALALYNSSPTIADCKFINNSATGAGGGISCRDGSSPTISNCDILNNTAGADGGGLFSWVNSVATLRHTVIAGNHADGFGGGVYYYECTALTVSDPNLPVIDFVTVADNSSNGFGGGICLWDSKMKFTNSILWNNSSQMPSGSQIALIDDSLDATTLSVNYCDVSGLDQGHLLEPLDSPECTLDWGKGNVQADPLFANPAAGNYHLKSASGHWEPTTRSWILDDGNNYDPADDQNSPCIDAGDPSVAVTAEYACNGSRVNIGADGNTEQASRSASQKCCMMCIPTDFNCDCRINLEDLAYLMDDWLKCNFLPRYYCVE